MNNFDRRLNGSCESTCEVWSEGKILDNKHVCLISDITWKLTWRGFMMRSACARNVSRFVNEVNKKKETVNELSWLRTVIFQPWLALQRQQQEIWRWQGQVFWNSSAQVSLHAHASYLGRSRSPSTIDMGNKVFRCKTKVTFIDIPLSLSFRIRNGF